MAQLPLPGSTSGATWPFKMRASLAVVCPVGNDQIAGVGIFTTSPDETRAIMAEDPGVKAGIFTVEVHPCQGFPGDALPG